MNENNDRIDRNVSITVELTGDYDDVVSKLSESDYKNRNVEPLTNDLATLLETIHETGGGTRSAIAERLPGDMMVSYDAEGVVHALQLLKKYDLVILDGNTWKPGR